MKTGCTLKKIPCYVQSHKLHRELNLSSKQFCYRGSYKLTDVHCFVTQVFTETCQQQIYSLKIEASSCFLLLQ